MNSLNYIYSKVSTLLIVVLITTSCDEVGVAKFDSIVDAACNQVPDASIFNGASSVSDISDHSAQLNWVTSPDAANYHVYDVTSGSPVYRESINDPNDSSVVIEGLTPNTSYIFRVRMVHKEGLSDLNTKDVTFKTLLAPDAPGVPVLNTPTVSIGGLSKPTIEVPGVKSGYTVSLYNDDSCTNLVGQGVSTGSSILIQLTNDLAFGVYKFTANSTNSAGEVSPCSVDSGDIYEYASYYPMVENGSASLLTSVGMTQVVSSSVDDGSVDFSLPFDFFISGSLYNNWNVGSNTYITAGTGYSTFSGLTAANPASPKFFLGATDNSYQGVYTNSGDNYFRVRYEGTASTSGTVGAPNIVYELTFYKPIDNLQYIQVTFGGHNRSNGLFGIASSSTMYDSQAPITPNSSYVFSGNVDGTSWTIIPDSKIIGPGVDE